MPYYHELANPLGYFDLLSDENKSWITSRLKTYSKGDSEQDRSELFEHIMVTDPDFLSQVKHFPKAVAVDGSLSVIESPNVTALKIASVWRDMQKTPVYKNGVLNPNSLHEAIDEFSSIGLIPGRGIYRKSGEGSWDMKFREEFYQNMRHIVTHNSQRRYSLMAFARTVLNDYSDKNTLECPNCSKGRITFDTSSLTMPCELCNADVYYSDYLTKALFAAREASTQPMLLIERLLLHALIEEMANGNIVDSSIEDTLFIADGSLQFFGLPEVAQIMLERIQKMSPYPAIVSFMKSGRVQTMLEYPGIEDHIPPGSVAMVTSDAWKMLFKTRGEAGIYGKAFAYRTKDGQKWFSFMVPPKIGDPVDNAPILNSWENYPHLSSICAFIEQNQSNANGPTVATLELIGQANKAASLPAVLSRQALQKIVNEIL